VCHARDTSGDGDTSWIPRLHPFLLQWNLYAADAASAASRALHKIGTMPGNSAHVAESFLRTSASFLNRDILIQPRMLRAVGETDADVD
jgi:hypothetical protein